MSRYLWSEFQTWIRNASLGYNNTILNNQGAGCKGIAMILSQQCNFLQMEYEIIMNNRAQSLIIKDLLGGDMGFINVYAPNDNGT